MFSFFIIQNIFQRFLKIWKIKALVYTLNGRKKKQPGKVN